MIVSGAWGVLWIACVVWAVIVVPATATSESPTTPVLVSGVLLLSLTVLGPDGNVGRARYELRVQGPKMADQLM